MDPYNIGGSFLGLGFSHQSPDGNGANGQQQHGEAAASASSSSAPHHADAMTNNADSLMKSYLQQCLDFHDEQQKHYLHQRDYSSVPQFVTAQQHSTMQQPPPAPLPVPPPTRTSIPTTHHSINSTLATTDVHTTDDSLCPPASITIRDQAASSPSLPPASAAAATASAVPSDPLLSHPSAQEAVAKARSIVLKFQQQQHNHIHSSSLTTTEASSLPSPQDYRFRRQEQLARERERLHKATLKNFAYVAKREEERLKEQLVQLQQAKDMEQKFLDNQNAAIAFHRLQQQKHAPSVAVLSSKKAGIGTSRQRAVEKSKQQTGHAVVRKNDDEHSTSSVALYLSGLEVSSSTTSSTATEDLVRTLFSCYGSIRRVHLYRHKQTGQLKGDALVVYNVRTLAEKQATLDAVCSQMNGAELPCGSILHVEPADAEYKQRRAADDDPTVARSNSRRADQCNSDEAAGRSTSYYGPSSGTMIASEYKEPRTDKNEATTGTTSSNLNEESGGDGGNNPGDDDDLDDFFDSLT